VSDCNIGVRNAILDVKNINVLISCPIVGNFNSPAFFFTIKINNK
jgi:hypothetical protein